MNIGDKLFTYIDSYKGIQEQDLMRIYNQYKNSLVFIGDEKQIYNPLTGAYVGIGMTYFNNVIAGIKADTDKLVNFDEHVHQNVVNSLWVEYNYEQFRGAFENDENSKWIAGADRYESDDHSLMTNQDIVIKGLHDYNPLTNQIKTYDAIGWGIPFTGEAAQDTYEALNAQFWNHINRKRGSAGSSGIQINVHHTGAYKTGIDESGFQYSYWEGQDYLTIDDSLTWSYIATQQSYMLNFSKKVAVEQANRVYHDILGGNEPVYVEKSFNEAFDTDDNGNLVFISDGEQVYVHIKNGTDTGEFVPVYISNEDNSGNTNHWYIYYYDATGNEYILLKTDDTSVTPGAINIFVDQIDTNTGQPTGTKVQQNVNVYSNTDLANKLFTDDGYDKNNDGSFKEVTWYHYDAEATAQGQMNLADGIQTLREVAYILDQITDGSDAGIELTYNIAQNAKDITYFKNLLDNKDEIVVTSVQGTSNNAFIILNSYSANNWAPYDQPAKGEAKIDLDLRLARTYDLVDPDDNTIKITYAAYLNTPDHTTNIVKRWIYRGDTTNEDYYYNMHDLKTSDNTKFVNLCSNLRAVTPENGGQQLVQLYIISTTQPTITDIDGNVRNNYVESEVIDLSLTDLSTFDWQDDNNHDQYILFNWINEELLITNNNSLVNGITTVDWVTTYVGWSNYNILQKIENVNGDVYDRIMTYISNMNVEDAAVEGQYVTYVEQVEGKIVVHRDTLPLDQILASQRVYGNDFYIEISHDQAKEITDVTKVFILNSNNQYVHPADLDEDVQYYICGTVNAFNKINYTSGTSDIEQTTYALLLNEGNVTYFRAQDTNKEIATANDNSLKDFIEYIPVDINELITNGITDSILNSLYYYNNSGLTAKYLDAVLRQRQDGGSEIVVTSYVTYLGAASRTNTGLADSWDVRHTIESMFTWVDLKTNTFIL